jgi:hypothetical protein
MLEPALEPETGSVTTEPAIIRVRIPDEDNSDKAAEVLLGILVLENTFLNDHLHSGNPVVFCLGLPSYFFHVGLCALSLGSVVWFYLELKTVDAPSIINSYGIADWTITLAAITALAIINLIELYKYLTSCWTRLLALCKYVSCSSR